MHLDDVGAVAVLDPVKRERGSTTGEDSCVREEIATRLYVI